MKTRWLPFTFVTILLCWLCFALHPVAGADTPGAYEYATLRWGGRENTHVIYPSGNVEVLANQFKGIKKPDRADERAFFMNLAMNALARQGYELVAMTPDDYVFKRAVKP
jgi:hypothetical protein